MLKYSYVWWDVARVLPGTSLLAAKVFYVVARVLIGNSVLWIIARMLLATHC